MLIDNKKFDFWFYLVLKGVSQLEAYLSFNGLARLCTENYKNPGDDMNGEDLLKHLTNFSLNQKSDKFVINEDYTENDNGNKWLA